MNKTGCRITKCPRDFYAKNMCRRHYSRWLRYGHAEKILYEPQINQISDKDLCWLAGLLEGEGCFGLTTNRNPRASIVIAMCDIDIINRVHKLIGVGGICKVKLQKEYHTQCYRYCVTGLDAEILMVELLPMMGKRRSARISEVLSKATRNDSD